MPEGDTIFRAARTLHRALSGHVVLSFESQLATLVAADRRHGVAGRIVTDVRAKGKHLLMAFSGDLLLRTHMRMHGSWHIYRPGERWRAPARDARIVVKTTEWLAIAFGVNDAELMTAAEAERHPRLSALGPDLLGESVDAAEVKRRMREGGARHIAEALLQQQSLAGIGNVFKSEVLFLCGAHPYRPVSDLDDEALGRLIARAVLLLNLNVQASSIVGAGIGGRNTTGRLHPGERLWVYGRAGRPCRRCGTPIESESETEGRRTYWCPTCQR